MSYGFGKKQYQIKISKPTICIQCNNDEDDKLINGLCYVCMCKNDECIRCKKKRNHKGWGWKCVECLTEINQTKIHQNNLQVIKNSKSKILETDKLKVKEIWSYACCFCKEQKLSENEIKSIEEDYIFSSNPCSDCKNNYNTNKYI